MKFEVKATYKMHKKKSVDVEVDAQDDMEMEPMDEGMDVERYIGLLDFTTELMVSQLGGCSKAYARERKTA